MRDLRRRLERLEAMIRAEDDNRMSADANAVDTGLPTTDDRAERCETCKFWRGLDTDLDPECRQVGQCLRLPPRIVGKYLDGAPIPDLDEEYSATRFPVTERDEWCGEWHGRTK